MKIRSSDSSLGFAMLLSFTILCACVNDNLETLAAKKPADSTNVTKTTGTTVTTTTTSGTSSGTTGTITTTPTATTVSFAKDIHPILVKYQCAGCHGSSYSSYIGASSLAKSGQLYGTMSWSSGYRPMPPGQKATTPELALLSNWIKEGSLNN